MGFDAREEAVVAGAASGTLKLWDLCQARRRRIRRRHRRRRRRRLGGRRRRRGGVGRGRKKGIGILNARGCHGVGQKKRRRFVVNNSKVGRSGGQSEKKGGIAAGEREREREKIQRTRG